ncbi:MAG TPA: C40 family peptidase, partial [Pseudomonadales bacterium]|nr:C40 family peptidase [Pseudomonadales bacterium]
SVKTSSNDTTATAAQEAALDAELPANGRNDLHNAPQWAQSLVKRAEQFQGVRYKYGGTSPQTGFDCSGFVGYVYKQYGVELPRDSRSQLKSLKSVKANELKPGDLVFYRVSTSPTGSHAAIYIGNGQIIHASPRARKVVIADMHDSYFTKRYVGAGRINMAEQQVVLQNIPATAPVTKNGGKKARLM